MRCALRNYLRLLAEDREKGVRAKIFYPLLKLLSIPYGLLTVFVRQLYRQGILRSQKLPFPVISVGNLTWGGSGKTPFVEYLARRVAERHKRPLILSRGYSHDEIEQFKSHLPNIKLGVGKDRYRAAVQALKEQPFDVAILDDGFQHWALRRDLDIVMINALNPFGNGQVLPRGILREPVTSLCHASLFVITHANLVKPEEIEALRKQLALSAPKALIVESHLTPLFFYRAQKRQRVSLDRLENRRVTSFSGVGTPRSFQLLMTQMHLKPIRNFEFGDHHVYTPAELEEIKNVSDLAGSEEIVTTEKDFHRAPQMIAQMLNPLVLATKLHISKGEEMLNEWLNRLLGGSR